MAIQTSGQIAMSDIMTELGISGQTALNDADVRGLIDKSSAAQMSMSEWYGAADVFAFNITSSSQSGLTLSTLATAAGWDGTTSVEATINSGVILNTITPNTAALTVNIANSTIINNGSITGKGGALGNSNPGGHAMSVTVSGISVQNNSGAFIAGGGGSGSGSQGGGGAGEADTPGTTTVAASTQATTSCYDGRGCSAVTGATNTIGNYSVPSNGYGYRTVAPGGPQGGGGGTGSTGSIGLNCLYLSGFDQRGRAEYGWGGCTATYTNNIGTGGGSVLSSTSNASGANSNGGGGWGTAGKGGGGAAGKAISGNGNTISVTNTGTIYGATA